MAKMNDQMLSVRKTGRPLDETGHSTGNRGVFHTGDVRDDQQGQGDLALSRYPVDPGPAPKTCQWPMSQIVNTDIQFCGADVVPGKPYCPIHCARAYRKPRPAETGALLKLLKSMDSKNDA